MKFSLKTEYKFFYLLVFLVWILGIVQLAMSWSKPSTIPFTFAVVFLILATGNLFLYFKVYRLNRQKEKLEKGKEQ